MQLCGRGVTLAGDFLHAAFDDADDGLREALASPVQGFGGVPQNRGHQLGGRVPGEGLRLLPACHFVEYRTEGEHVRGRTDGQSLDLLGRHVWDRPHHGPLAGQRMGQAARRVTFAPGLCILGIELGQAEIEHPDPSGFLDHDVGRLEVAMRDAFVVRGPQRIREGNGDFEELVESEPALGNQVFERFSVDELHRVEVNVFRGFDAVDRDDVRMIQCGDGSGFAFETLPPDVVPGQQRRQDLERDYAFQPGVLGRIDLAHPAGAETA